MTCGVFIYRHKFVHFQVVFLVKGPIYLVCISCTEEPYESLRAQLELIYGQVSLFSFLKYVVSIFVALRTSAYVACLCLIMFFVQKHISVVVAVPYFINCGLMADDTYSHEVCE